MYRKVDFSLPKNDQWLDHHHRRPCRGSTGAVLVLEASEVDDADIAL